MADQERGIFDDEATKPEAQEQKPEAKEPKPAEQEKGFFADDPATEGKERGIFDDEPRQPEEPKREEPAAPDRDGDRITIEVKQPEQEITKGAEGWRPEVLEREENAALRDQLGPEAVQRTPGDVLPAPEWKGDGPDLRTPDEMAAGVQLEPDEYTRRSSAEFYDAMRAGDRAGGPSKDRELYDLPDLKDRDGFTPGQDAAPDRDGFAQGKSAPEKTMTGAEIKEYAEQAIETRRQEEKDQFKALDEAKAKGADPQTIDAMKSQVKDTIGDRLTAESLSKSITPDMMNQSINIGELKEDMKQDLQKIQNAVQQHKDAHPSQSIQPHISHGMDR